MRLEVVVEAFDFVVVEGTFVDEHLVDLAGMVRVVLSIGIRDDSSDVINTR